MHLIELLLLLLVSIVALGLVLWLIRRHRSRTVRDIEQAQTEDEYYNKWIRRLGKFEYPPPIEEHEYHQKMAEELKAELLRRAEKWEQTHDDRAP